VSEHEPDVVEADVPAEEPQGASEECMPRRPLWLRILIGTGIAIASLAALLAVTAVLLYNFGGMWGSAVPGVLELSEVQGDDER
jgi:hypothetical protein